MNEIVALLQSIAPVISTTTLRQLSQVMYGMLISNGRITMLELSRWTEKGGSYRTIQRLYHTPILWLQIQWLLFTSQFHQTDREYIAAGDAERLLEQLDDPETSHEDRLDIGKRLNKLGNPRHDPRPGVGLVNNILPLIAVEGFASTFTSLQNGEMRLWGDKSGDKGLPDIVWVKVDGGSIQIEQQTFQVHPFFIAKYPITYKQFEAFVEAEDGFSDKRWWKNLSAHKDHKSKPLEQNFKFYNHPRESVSWYDSIAFCRWLNARMGFAKLPANLTIKTLENFQGIRLPAEWEWQWAATGGNTQYAYPWGTEWDESKANIREIGLWHTTAVGMYPTGSAPCGALDLSGNVFEWCLNEHGNPENLGLRNNDSFVSFVVRGGSWHESRQAASAFYRYYYFDPGVRNHYCGFRVIVRPPGME